MSEQNKDSISLEVKNSLPPITGPKSHKLPEFKDKFRRKKLEDSEKDTLHYNKFSRINPSESQFYQSQQIDNLPPQQPEKGLILNIQGVVNDADYSEDNTIFFKYDIVFGDEWKKLSGQSSGQSQYACLGKGCPSYFVWNMPFDIRLCCENPENLEAWPQLVISCFNPDLFGREILKAYGTCFIPTTAGSHERSLSMFSPISSYSLIDVLSFLYGEKAELINAPKVLASGEGREILRCKSEGSLKVKFDIQCQNMEKFGFDM